MASQQALQDRILKEIIDRIPQREVSAPYIKNGYRYRHIYEPGCEYAIYQRQSAFSEEWDEWETLLDANKRAAHSEFYSMGGMAITPDNTIMALAEDFLSRRQYGIRFRNLETGNWYPNCWITLNPALSGQMTLDFLLCTQASSYAAALSGLASRHRYASIARYTDLRRKRRYLLRQPA